MKEKIVLIQPPFFRLAGSHNNRTPVELTYWSRILNDANIEHIVYNADASEASKFWRWRQLFDNYDVFRAGVKATNPLYYELFETIMSFEPTAVIICAGDAFLASVDTGNPFAAANLARLFKNYGVYTIGVGHFLSLDSARFQNDFDVIVANGPNYKMIDIIRTRAKGFEDIGKFDTGIIPMLTYLHQPGQLSDIVMTSKGCAWNCTFCKAGVMSSKFTNGVTFRMANIVAEDIIMRNLRKVYLGDMVFSASRNHLIGMRNEFAKYPHLKDMEYTVEDKVNIIDEEKCQIMQEIGVKNVKIGLELFDDEALKRYNKHYDTNDIVKATALYRKYGMRVIAYLMVGGPNIPDKAYANTIEFCKSVDFDGYVISTYAYWNQKNRDYSEDSHFSPDVFKHWGISHDILDDFFKLQENKGGNSSLKNFL